jgi:hypothetical protein
MIPLVITEDSNGNRSLEGMRQPSYVDFIKLAANVGATLTVPSGAKHVLFSAGTTVDFFVKYTSDTITSAVYTANITDGTAAEQNPKLRTLVGVTGIGIISPDSGDLTLSWFG